MEAFEQWKVSEDDDGVICEVNGIVLVLNSSNENLNPEVARRMSSYPGDTEIFNCGDFVA